MTVIFYYFIPNANIEKGGLISVVFKNQKAFRFIIERLS